MHPHFDSVSFASFRTPTGAPVAIGGMTSVELNNALASANVGLNEHAKTLLADVANPREREQLTVVFRSVTDMGLPVGGTSQELFARAADNGLLLCPVDLAPYLRLALVDQDVAPDSLNNAGRAPSSSVTVASPPLVDDDAYPKGFYLRVVDGRPWLRGYRCDATHEWSPQDLFAFRAPPA